jgi:signal transduction histidine kinase
MRPWHYGLAFGALLAVLLGAMGWVSWTAVRLDRAQAQAGRKSAFEENVRLALWRMETVATPILIRESARPYFVYSSFYPAERAYNRMFQEIPGQEVLVPSPLLKEPTPQVLLHFQVGPDGAVTSPQAAEGPVRVMSVRAYDNDAAIEQAASRLAQFRAKVDRARLLAALPAVRESAVLPAPLALVNAPVAAGARDVAANAAQQAGQQGLPVAQQVELQEQARSEYEFNVRNYQRIEGQQRVNPRIRNSRDSWRQREPVSKVAPARETTDESRAQPPVVSPVAEGMMTALWLDDALVLARRVTVDGGEYVQGCWLNWPEIKTDLLHRVGDLLADADLMPAVGEEGQRGARLLAGLPVRLVAAQPLPAARQGLSPVQYSLVVAGCGALLALFAVGALLLGAVSLGEKRGAFVSAVTHELRTPLTTFRMYSEMLAEGMVTDEEKRKRYLLTLCAEGSRLSHLVENVLSFARLERGRYRGHREVVTARAVFERIRERLVQRAEQAGMSLSVGDGVEALDVGFSADMGAVEQILFNLVDNAAKYAARAADKRIELLADVGGGMVRLRVRDHGPGVEAVERRRLFRPFHKSAKHAAESAPGVGLGLALSRRLARQMGGDLVVCSDVGDGACFELRLPCVPQPAG